MGHLFSGLCTSTCITYMLLDYNYKVKAESYKLFSLLLRQPFRYDQDQSLRPAAVNFVENHEYM